MMKHVGTVALWLLGCAVVFASCNIYDPYLVMMRGLGAIGLLIASFIVAGEALNAGADLLLVAYDGLQFHRIFDCALTASGNDELDGSSLQKSDARLKSRIQRQQASAQIGPEFH